MMGCDDLVLEYCMYRGFTKTKDALELERSSDRSKLFEATQIVSQLFQYLQTYAVADFISMWDFLNSRFFIHLDQENIEVVRNFKLDLIRYYLVRCYSSGHREKILEFFSKHSDQILSAESAAGMGTGNGAPLHGGGGGLALTTAASSSSSSSSSPSSTSLSMVEGGSMTGGSVNVGISSFRGWYVLPYMEQPERDPDFAPYFTPAFGEILRNGIQNYLSMVLRTCAPPKLLLMEKWFRSEKQKQSRDQLKNVLKREENLRVELKKKTTEVRKLQETIRNMLIFMRSSIENAVEKDDATGRSWRANSRGSNGGSSLLATSPSTNSGLLETDEEVKESCVAQLLEDAQLLSTVIKVLDDSTARAGNADEEFADSLGDGNGKGGRLKDKGATDTFVLAVQQLLQTLGSGQM